MNKEQADKAFTWLKHTAIKHGVVDIADCILSMDQFKRWSGAGRPDQHHYGTYGLVIHTSEVAQLCDINNQFFEKTDKHVDPKKLFLAALFHDVGKMWDYTWKQVPGPTEAFSGLGFWGLKQGEPVLEWHVTEHKTKIHHISRSALSWNEAKIKHKFDDPDDDVLHAILAHHGLREWGSPVTPQTHLAYLLHLCDSISARMEDCNRRKK